MDEPTPKPELPSARRRGLFGLLRRLQGDVRVRFLFVGAFNTGFGYVLFVIFELLFRLYFVSLYGSFAVAILTAFVLHRHYTYQVAGTGRVWVDFLRFTSVYAVTLAVNTVALPLLVEVAGLSAILAQGIIAFSTTMISYFGHKFFSFRRPRAVPPSTRADFAPSNGD